MLPVKGIKLMIISVLLASLLMPFTVFASTQTIIVPTWDSSTTQNEWSIHLTVENYCEGTNVSTNSCKLMFTVDSNYYGYIYFDGYSGNTKWIDFKMVFIADGYGEYNYNLWSNGQVSINNVNISLVNLVKPDSNVDLTQIIQLLTAIQSDTSSIDLLVDQTKTQIINVLSQLVVSNGYLDIISKLRMYNFPFESYKFIAMMYALNYQSIGLNDFDYYQYPMFRIASNTRFIRDYFYTNTDYYIIFGVNDNIYQGIFDSTFDFNQNFDYELTYLDRSFNVKSTLSKLIKLKVRLKSGKSNGTYDVLNISNKTLVVLPVYIGDGQRLSTDFCLKYGFTNDLLSNLNIIANGTTQSNAASSDLQSNTSDFQTSANQYYNIENTYNNNMNTQLNNIDTSTGLSGFGGNFLTSANWVRVQYQNLTNGNPFGSLVTYGLTLGLALLLLGKVFL